MILQVGASSGFGAVGFGTTEAASSAVQAKAPKFGSRILGFWA